MSTKLTPSEDLAIEALLGRYRSGETTWTMEARHARVLKQLEAKGLVWWKSGIVENTVLAGLTDAGVEEFVSEHYKAPLQKKLEQVTEERNTLLRANELRFRPRGW